jgi:hypothetical protein
VRVCPEVIWVKICPVVSSCVHGNEPSVSITGGEFLTSWASISFSRRALLHRVR